MFFVRDDINVTFSSVIPKYRNGEDDQSFDDQVSGLKIILRIFRDEINLDINGRFLEKGLKLNINFKIISVFNAFFNISMTMKNIVITLINFVHDFSNLTIVSQVGHPQVFVNVI